MPRAVIIGSGSEIAPTRMTNDQMARIMDTSDEWIRARSGVETRHFATPDIATSDLGVAASRKALEAAGVEREEVDLVVFATMTPDHYFPGCGTLLQAKLGLRTVPCFDIRRAISSLWGLSGSIRAIRGQGTHSPAGGRRSTPGACPAPRAHPIEAPAPPGPASSPKSR